MSVVTRDEIRRFLLEKYADAIADLGRRFQLHFGIARYF